MLSRLLLTKRKKTDNVISWFLMKKTSKLLPWPTRGDSFVRDLNVVVVRAKSTTNHSLSHSCFKMEHSHASCFVLFSKGNSVFVFK